MKYGFQTVNQAKQNEQLDYPVLNKNFNEKNSIITIVCISIIVNCYVLWITCLSNYEFKDVFVDQCHVIFCVWSIYRPVMGWCDDGDIDAGGGGSGGNGPSVTSYLLSSPSPKHCSRIGSDAFKLFHQIH